ncbi:major facilitator superfamily domain-containing protein [Stachybotrys elegans]|uniref:Major facilitator superfamily domain-containing protein n=1 Tax=Stachybotrys elegans TaxID=80388 RepID=A0A8K0SP72_9HYPO|nr:major facilitator superfamily domain-containing protein [Stachybotrys elegans]
MSDEKETAPEVNVGVSDEVAVAEAPAERPAGWIYRGFKIGGSEIWYASPKAQLLVVSIVCFLCPGMFNALTGLGGAGVVDTTVASDANTALNSTFAVVAFFAGTFANRLGLRITLALGGLGYCIYSASFLSYVHNENRGFVIFAGAFLGICAGLLWTAQGAIMMSYPPEKSKGRYISWFWIIFNMGAVIGSLIPLGQNIDVTTGDVGSVTDGTYIGFIVLMLLGAIVALFIVNAHQVIREDNTKVILMKNPSWVSEFKGLWEVLYMEPWIVLLFPMFFCSNIFYTYQTANMNGTHFNIRTRSLNNLLYWLAQIIAAIIVGYALDYEKLSRTLRAKAAFGALVFFTFAIWGPGWAWQRQQAVREVATTPAYRENEWVDWTDGGEKYIGPMFLYFFYGFYDAVWQTTIYWYMGALSNSGRKTANLAGFYKGIQSAGAAIFWRFDSLELPYDTIFGATWGCLAASLLFAAPVIFWKIQDTVPVDQDLKFSDETIEDIVVAPVPDKTKGEV